MIKHLVNNCCVMLVFTKLWSNLPPHCSEQLFWTTFNIIPAHHTLRHHMLVGSGPNPSDCPPSLKAALWSLVSKESPISYRVENNAWEPPEGERESLGKENTVRVNLPGGSGPFKLHVCA